MFLVTLVVYLIATVITALSFNIWSFALCRFFTGSGIGGEYAAIDSAIDELIPARLRGTVDLAINGTFWVGAAMGAALTIVLLEPARALPSPGWLEIARLMATRYRRRAVFGLVLMSSLAAWIGVDAERRSLEQVCPPLGCDLPA